MPHIGLSTYDLTAAQFVGLARGADRAGFASLWLGRAEPLTAYFRVPGSDVAVAELGRAAGALALS